MSEPFRFGSNARVMLMAMKVPEAQWSALETSIGLDLAHAATLRRISKPGPSAATVLKRLEKQARKASRTRQPSPPRAPSPPLR
jgi:hypothetical protein